MRHSISKQNRPLPALLAMLAMLPMLFTGCERLPELTPETKTGANTFSCLVDGKVWIPKGHTDFGTRVNGINGGFLTNYVKRKLDVSIRTYKYLEGGSKNDELFVYLDHTSTGTYAVNSRTTTTGAGNLNPGRYIWFQDGETGKSYITSPEYVGTITITRSDTTNLIISGTFDGLLGNSQGEMIKITKGRFDINQNTLNK